MDNLDQLFGCPRARIVAGRIRVDQMFEDMVFDHLCNEPLQRSPAGGRLLKDGGAFGVLLDRALNRIELTADPSQPHEKLPLLLFLRRVRHFS